MFRFTAYSGRRQSWYFRSRGANAYQCITNEKVCFPPLRNPTKCTAVTDFADEPAELSVEQISLHVAVAWNELAPKFRPTGRSPFKACFYCRRCLGQCWLTGFLRASSLHTPSSWHNCFAQWIKLLLTMDNGIQLQLVTSSVSKRSLPWNSSLLQCVFVHQPQFINAQSDSWLEQDALGASSASANISCFRRRILFFVFSR